MEKSYNLVQFSEKEGKDALAKYELFLSDNNMEVAIVSSIGEDLKIEVKKMLVKRVPIVVIPEVVVPISETIDAPIMDSFTVDPTNSQP